MHTIRRVTSAAGAIVISCGLVLMLAGPAQASVWQFSDGFEGNPSAVWTLYRVGTGGGGYDYNAGTARTPYHNAWLSMQGSGWSSVGRTVHLTPATVHQTSCTARIYALPLGTAKLNLEIIKPSTWTYISLKTVTLTGSSYQAVTTDSWNALDVDVFVRVSLIYTGSFSAVRLDDLAVQCIY